MVLTVAFYTLTVKNLLRVSPRLPAHCLMRAKLDAVVSSGTEYGVFVRNVQQDHGVGFHRHAL